MMKAYTIEGIPIMVDFDNEKVYLLQEVGGGSERTETKPKGDDWRSKPRKCKKCQKSGHRSDNCPKAGKDDEEDLPDPAPETGLKAKVRKLAKTGMNSNEIASALKISLEEVNDNW